MKIDTKSRETERESLLSSDVAVSAFTCRARDDIDRVYARKRLKASRSGGKRARNGATGNPRQRETGGNGGREEPPMDVAGNLTR